jgi:hypothetical protein
MTQWKYISTVSLKTDILFRYSYYLHGALVTKDSLVGVSNLVPLPSLICKQRTSTTADEQLMDTNCDDDSDDDLYLSLPGSDAESDLSPHVHIPDSFMLLGAFRLIRIIQSRSDHRRVDKDTNASQKASALMGDSNPTHLQTKIVTHVRGETSSGSSRPSNPNMSDPLLDLSKSVKGMYRILDLISEEGSGGLGKVHAPFSCSLKTFLCQLTRSLLRKAPCANT